MMRKFLTIMGMIGVILTLSLISAFMLTLFLEVPSVKQIVENVVGHNERDDAFIQPFDANDRYYAHGFPSGGPPGLYSVIVYDAKLDKSIILANHSKGVTRPRFSSIEDNVIYVVLYKPQKEFYEYRKCDGEDCYDDFELENWELFKCNIQESTCSQVFEIKKSISNPIELGNGRLLFVASAPHAAGDPFSPNIKRLQFSGNDFYIREKGGEIKQISDADFHSLSRVSFTGNSLVFSGDLSGTSPYRDFEIRGYAPDGESKIYKIPFDSFQEKIEFNKDSFVPILKIGNRYDTKPSMISDLPLIVFLSAVSYKDKRGWNYEIILYDFEKKKIIKRLKPKSPQSFSSPILTKKGTVRYGEFYRGIISLHEFDMITSKQRLVKSISLVELQEKLKTGHKLFVGEK